MISCPACAGVVRAESRHHGEFICSVGHAFSLDELYTAKEDQLEYAQWSLVALLKHLQMILRTDLVSGSELICRFGRPELERRLDQVTRHITLVEQLIEDTRLPSRREEMSGDERPSHEGK